MEEKNTLNVRRMAGAILLAIQFFARFGEAMSINAFFEYAQAYKTFVFIMGFWCAGIAIWYFVTLKKPTNKTAELVAKVLFFIMLVFYFLAGLTAHMENLSVYAVITAICYIIGCPWGTIGYKKHPYQGYEGLAKRREKIKNDHNVD